MKYHSEFLWTHSWDVGTLVPNKSKFLTLISNVSVLPGSNFLHLNTIETRPEVSEGGPQERQ